MFLSKAAMDSSHQIPLLFAILFLLWSVDAHPPDPQTPSMCQRYRQWMVRYNKTYPNAIEKRKRFQIFQENVKYIHAFNVDRNKSYILGLNQFTDLTNEEIVTKFTCGYQPHVWKTSAISRPKKIDLRALPKSWDWRAKGAITPVKTQTCGNCWAFTGVAEVESANFIATGRLSILSEQEILDCDDHSGKGACRGGGVQEVYEYVRHNGLTTEAQYPNNPINETCNNRKRWKDRLARVSRFVNMRSFISDGELMEAVVKQPVSVGIDMSAPALTSYKRGVFTGPCGFNLTHVMQIVGFDETQEGLKYWILRNSWGAEWGEGGYVRLQRDTRHKEGLCGVNLTPSYPVY